MANHRNELLWWLRRWLAGFHARSRRVYSLQWQRGRMHGHDFDDWPKAEIPVRARVRSKPVIIF